MRDKRCTHMNLVTGHTQPRNGLTTYCLTFGGDSVLSTSVDMLKVKVFFNVKPA